MLESRLRRFASPGRSRGSLRGELVFNLAFFAGATLLISLWTVLTVAAPGTIEALPLWAIATLLIVYVGMFVGLAHVLIGRLVLRSLHATIDTAQAIVGGDFGRRVPTGNTRETAALADAINRLTDQLLEKQAALTRNVESLDRTNRELHATRRELVQAEKLASIGRLSAGVAHEIGNPLGAIIGYLEVMRRRGADEELVGEALAEGRRIDRIVRSLLDFARPGEARAERLDMNRTVHRVLELLRGRGRLDGVEVACDLADDLFPVRADPHRLDQVLVNLLVNAVLATSGRGAIRVSTRNTTAAAAAGTPPRRAEDPPEVTYAHLRRGHPSERGAEFEEDEPLVELVVEDDGPGIPEEHLESIFDPFFTTRSPGEGTGLGLAIVTTTVADFGGRVEVDNRAEGGARFTVRFPAEPHDTAP